jgi:hypothetical protein
MTPPWFPLACGGSKIIGLLGGQQGAMMSGGQL